MKLSVTLVVLAAAALSSAPHPAAAGAYRTFVEKSVAAGVPTHIWTFANCVGRTHYPFSGTAFTEHGSLTFKEALANRCGLPNVITRQVWYTSNAGFVGVDTVTFPRRRGHSEVFSITVH